MTVDQHGNIHAGDGKFDGHLYTEGDTEVLDDNDRFAGKPFFVSVRREAWYGDQAVEVGRSEFDAAPILAGFSQRKRDSILDGYGGTDWMFEVAVDRGLAESWYGPYTLDFDECELEEWFEGNPPRELTRAELFAGQTIARVAELADVNTPEPGSAGADFLIRARDVAVQLFERPSDLHEAHNEALSRVLEGDEDQRWAEFVSLKLYQKRHYSWVDEAGSAFEDAATSRRWKAANDILWAARRQVAPTPPATPTPSEPEPSPEPVVVDLVAALHASVEAAKARRLANG